MKQTKILETRFERKCFKLTTTKRKKENLQQGGRKLCQTDLQTEQQYLKQKVL